MRVRLRGRAWRIDWVERVDDEDSLGECDLSARRIRIRAGLPARLALDVLLHELLHALRWKAPEKRVNETATEIARVLARVGYRTGYGKSGKSVAGS